jgi:hypothetical protein
MAVCAALLVASPQITDAKAFPMIRARVWSFGAAFALGELPTQAAAGQTAQFTIVRWSTP